MTKIKNTKKGMAKKTLSISLAVAMLATSNVPVWAAEDLFTDGAAAVETVEAPVEELFSDATEEVVEEAPVVEEEVEAPEAQAQDANNYYDARLSNVVVRQNGWASYVTVEGTVLGKDMNTMTKTLNYRWVEKISENNYHDITNQYHGKTSGTITNGNLYGTELIPGPANVGKDLYLNVFLQGAGADSIDVYIPAGKVAKEDLNNFNADSDKNENFNVVLKDGVWKENTSSFDYGYNGKEIKPPVDPDHNKTFVKFQDERANLYYEDFSVEYRHHKNNFIDTNNECEVVLTPNNTELYTGIVTQKYNITPRVYQKDDIKMEVNKEYEYTGEFPVPSKDDIILKETIRGDRVLDSYKTIDKVWVGAHETDPGVGEIDVYASLHDDENYWQGSLPKYDQGADKNDGSLHTTYKIVERDLSKCTAEIDSTALNGRDLGTIISDPTIANKVHIYDADGNELKLVFGQDYIIGSLHENMATQGTYAVAIKAKGDNTKGAINTKLTVVTHDFDECVFINTDNHNVEGDTDSVITSSVPYTGETVTKDLRGLRFAHWVGVSGKNPTGYEVLSAEAGKEDYKITITGTDAGTNKGRIIVEGVSSTYSGAKKVYKFDITPAKVVNVNDDDATPTTHDDVKVARKVVFDPSNLTAADYAPKVTVKAHNTADPAKEFTLTEGTDYVVKYDFLTRNELGAKIRTTVTIKNPNFRGNGTVTDTVFVEETTISKKSLDNCEIKVLGTYTYTGAEIIPDVEVKDGDEVLVKDVDYVVKATNNINVGEDAVVKVYGKATNEDGGAIYDPTTYKEANFTITPADAKDIEVVYKDQINSVGGNTGVMYTGKPIKPTIIGVYLNGNDVTEQFKTSYPGTYVNVGKGMVVLTPVDFKGHMNFTGTKDATFNILPRTLEGKLTVYDEDGHVYSVQNGILGKKDKNDKFVPVKFDYDTAEHIFADAEFVPCDTTPKNNNDFDNYAGYVTKDDYEIKYVDNVYGGKAYIYVEGKGNFEGGTTIKDAENGIVKSVVEGTAYSYQIETYKLKEQHVVIEDAEYAGGQAAKPNVTVTVLGQKLVEGKDYVIDYSNRGALTNGKTEKVVVKGIKAFGTSPAAGIVGYYAVVKRDMANTDITVTEKSNGTYDVVVRNTGVVVPASEYTITEDGNSVTITAVEDSKYYTGSQTVELQGIEIVKPETPVITNVDVTGNKANVILAGATDGATGYDYVISKDRFCTDTKAYDDVNKNILNTNTVFNYVQEGVYYAYCHAWVRDENGKKVFSDWSNGLPFVVSSITPDTPKITSVSVKGSTVKVTYTKTANASGYDVVLGSSVARVAGEKRPVNYGTLVEKNIMGDTVTATFKNVPAGTYYAGLHAFNRTSEDGKKVFSPWSATKTVKVK